jgi:ribosomal-protein-alanine N-acetyltransferase
MTNSEGKEQMTLSLERASVSDIETLLKLEKTVSGSNTYSPMLEAEEWKEEFEKSTVYLLKMGGKVVGNLSYEQKTPDHLYISGLVVIPEYQGRGIARNALTQLIEEHPEATRIDLVTHPDNPALKLYESLGFVVEDRKENFYGDGEPRLILVLAR